MSSPEEVDADTSETDEEEQPHGTVLMMVLFGLLIIAMWVWMYLTLLERS